jgi:hypothetical protein
MVPHARCMGWYYTVEPWHHYYRGICPISCIIKRGGAKYDTEDIDTGETFYKDYNWEA